MDLARRLATPGRPCRRMTVVLALWTGLCYVVFRSTVVGSADGSGGGGALLAELREEAMNATALPLNASVVLSSSSDAVAASISLSTSTTVMPLDGAPLVDHTPQKNTSQVLRDLSGQLPNLPLVFLRENEGRGLHLGANASCAKMPSVFDLKISNTYWQVAETSNATFYLYSSFLDRREANKLGPTIRILGMIDRVEPAVNTYCQIWFGGQSEPVISRVLEYKYIWFRKWGNAKDGFLQPYLLSCRLPPSFWSRVPVAVSLVQSPCDAATNSLRVTYNALAPGEKRRQFAVCVKGLDFPTEDISVRLVEWMELLSVMGADKIFMYNLEAHPNVTKVVDHYVRSGLVELTPLTLPGHQPNMAVLQHLFLKHKMTSKRQNEVIPYNDCLYRNMYRFRYVALLDVDEVIVPAEHRTWADMMAVVEQQAAAVSQRQRASFHFQNVYFLDEMLAAHRPEGFFPDIPGYLHMLQHVYRSANFTKPGQYVKCFHSTDHVLSLHNHFPLACLGGKCASFPVATDVGRLQHYRADCVAALRKSCANEYKSVSVLDSTLWRYKEIVGARAGVALAQMGFLRPSHTSGL